LEALGQIYDAFLIASDSRTASVGEDLQFSDLERSKCRYIGYVSIPVSRAEIENTRLHRGLKPGDRWVVCSAGAGLHARDLIQDCLDLAKEFAGIHFDIVSGPSCLPLTHWTPPSIFFDGRVRVSSERADLRGSHAAADAVICHGGYNTLTETMEGGAALIVDVRHDPHGERVKHARRLQSHYPISIVDNAVDLKLNLRAAVTGNTERRPVRDKTTLQFDGCGEFKRMVSETLEISIPEMAAR